MPDLKIHAIKGKRSQTRQTALQKAYIMPPPGLLIICGGTGSGKTNLVTNLLSRPEMLKKAYDLIYVFCLSPCTMLLDHISTIEEKRVFQNGDPEKLVKIVETQKKYIKEHSFRKAPHILIILDDMVNSPSFMNHSVMRELAFACTHSKISVMLMTQNYCSVPRSIRMNCHSMILMSGLKDTELERFTTEAQSPYLSKKDFIAMVKYALDKPYSFLFVNHTHPNKKLAFRRNFEEILEMVS